jgi:hypothetical protein
MMLLEGLLRWMSNKPKETPPPSPDKDIGVGVGQFLTGVCPACDQVCAAFVNYFGDPVYEPKLIVVHDEDGIHSPWLVSSGRKFALYGEMRAQGWKPYAER